MISEIQVFFDINYELIFFAYGLVFFMLGLTIALQPRQRSRLRLAQSLGWLSIFGITHGLHEWGHLFIPLQAGYMNHAGAAVLQIFQTLLLGISFFALFAFGADLYRTRWPRLLVVPYLLILIWLFWLIYLGLFRNLGVGLWQQYASIGARYLLAIPAGLLTAFSIRHVSHRQIRPLQLSRIDRMLRIAGIAFIAYAIMAGLIVPYADFFPANWLNQSVLVQAFGVPVEVYRSLIGLVLVITIVGAMQVFDVEIDRLIEHMQVAQSLAAERERLGRELHDGAIQLIYSAGLILQSTRSKVEEESIVAQRLDSTISTLNEAIGSLRATMTDLRPQPEGLPLFESLQNQTADPRLTTLLDVTFQNTYDSQLFHFDPTQTMHILSITGEALSNVVRHAQASQVNMSVGDDNGHLVIMIMDDGIGYDPNTQDKGYGVRNMKDRARLLGAQLQIESNPLKGTLVRLSVPMENI